MRGCPGSLCRVVGGVGKLFAYFIRNYAPTSVMSYCDFEKFTGKSYEAIGMKFHHLTPPGFKWWFPKDNTIKNRNPLKRKEFETNGGVKLYNSGSKVYVWNR
jgi:hypothetical protein